MCRCTLLASPQSTVPERRFFPVSNRQHEKSRLQQTMVFRSGIEGTPGSAAPKWARRVLAAVCTSLMTFGCVSQAHRMHPEFTAMAERLHSAGLMPCEMRFYDATAYGVVERRDDWSATGRRNLVQALIMSFEKKGYHIEPVRKDKRTEAEIEEIQALYRSVNKSIRLHAYGPQLFPEKKRNFRYSVGPIPGLLRKLNADSLIFVQGVDHVWPGKEDGFVSVAVADASGTIVWYCVQGFRGGSGLRDPKRAAEVIENIIKCYPEASG